MFKEDIDVFAKDGFLTEKIILEKTFIINLLSYTNSFISMSRFRAISYFDCNAIFC